jgi:hypothetical protein
MAQRSIVEGDVMLVAEDPPHDEAARTAETTTTA